MTTATDDPRFYFFLAIAFAAIAFGGFALTYLYPLATKTFEGPALLHIHGVLFFGWTVLFIVQAKLAATAIHVHRTVGLAGISLATAMVFAALLVIVNGLTQAAAIGSEATARPLSIVPVTAIASFAVLFVLAITNRRRPQYHKRYMVLATITLLPPAVARVLFVLFAPESAGARPSFSAPVPDLDVALHITFLPALIVDLLIFVPILHDWRTLGRPHPVYVIGGSSLVALHVGRMFVAQSPFWHGVTSALLALGR